MNQSKILITGASGCVAQYTTDWLLNNSDSELFLLLRDPSKLTAINIDNPRIKILVGDLRNLTPFQKDLSTINKVIHTATAWGDPERAYKVNVIAVNNLLNLLNPEIIEQIIYFSTASILDKNLRPLNEALIYGTEYIQTKAICLQELEKHSLANKIIAVFPTLVFGGSVDDSSSFPTSYLTAGLEEATKWLWLARFIRAYSKFHFIHAADIAFVCGHLVTTTNKLSIAQNKQEIRKLVLAQPYLSIDKAIATLLDWKGMRKMPGLPLWGWLVKVLIKILPIEISQWDRFSIKQRHFIHHPITNPESLGGKSLAPTLEHILVSSALKSRKIPKKGLRSAKK